MLNITSPPLLDSTGQDIVTGLSNIVSKLDTFHIEADRVSYDNTDSGLVATDVQAAIDRVVIALDTKADKTIIATVESNNTASKNYSTGNLLIKGSVLYRAKTEISQGTSFVVDTNIEAVTIEELLNEKQDLLTFDNTPSSDSDNPVKSSGIYTALSGKSDNSIIATVETSTSSKDYAVGDYLILDGILYQVTDAIGIGDTIESGVNVSAVVLADELEQKLNRSDVDDEMSAASENPVQNKVITANKADVITASESGNIVAFGDGAPYPVKDLRMDIDPVQDLHGYNNPWPAGGGENLFDCPSTGSTIHTVTMTPNGDGSYTLSGTANSSPSIWYAKLPYTIPAGTVVTISLNNTDVNSEVGVRLLDTATAEAGTRYSLNSNATAISATATMTLGYDMTYVMFYAVTNHGDISDITLKPKIEIGAEATPWTPYSNICPITGWSAVNLWRTGKNLYPGGVIYHNPNSTAKVIAGNTYTISFVKDVTGIQYNWAYLMSDGTWEAQGMFNPPDTLETTMTVTVPSGVVGINIYYTGGSAPSVVPTIQLELGSTPTDYAPYTGTTYPITIPAAAGTVYGGELDVTNGVLKITLKGFLYSSVDYYGIYAGHPLYMMDIPDYSTEVIRRMETRNDTGILISNILSKTTGSSASSLGDCEIRTQGSNVPTKFYFRADNFADLTALNAYLSTNPLQVVAELATPITYPLSDITVETLAGQNVMWADCGPLDVEYRANTNLYLEKHIPVLSDANPQMDGTATPGTSQEVARADHVHGHDTSKQNVLTFDNSPTKNSNNPVKSGGVYDALAEKVNNAAIAQVEESTTATRNYAVNSLLILDGVLYETINAIAIGDTIVPGTNVIATTISEIIDSILPAKPTTNGSYYLNYFVNGNSINYTWIPRSQWEQFRDVVRSGQASTLYPIGNQLADTWYQSASTSYNVPWDIVHYSTDKKAYLQWHYTIPDAVAFDQPEALYYFDGTEQPGQYYIQIKYAYGTGWVVDDCISFTLTSQPDKDDQLVIATATSNATDPTNGIAWNVYAKGGSTSKQSGTTSNSSTGTKLGETSSLGTGYTNGKVNSPQRVVYGYNRWSQSAYRQYLNSSYPAGYWWSAQNPWDRPPAVATTLQGFMRGFTDDFLDVVKKSQVITALNTVEGLSETSEITEDYFFLPSLQQLYVSPQLADVEGEDWDYYKNLATSAGLTGRFSTGVAYPELIKYAINSTSSAQSWRLRSATRGNANITWGVYTSGTVSSNSAYYANRCAPACIIS